MRVLYTCRNARAQYKARRCTAVWSVDYPECSDTIAHSIQKWFRIDAAGKKIRPGSYEDARCPQCKSFPARFKPIKGVYNENHRCDDRCLYARGPECTCSCGGMNHGRGYLICTGVGDEKPGDLFTFVPPRTNEDVFHGLFDVPDEPRADDSS